jgi:hypothetical protein
MAHGLGELTLGELAKLKSVFAPLPGISVDYFIAAINDVTGHRGDTQLLRLVFDLIDADGSGEVSWDELMAHIETLREDDLYGDITGREFYSDATVPAPEPPASQSYHHGVIHHMFYSPKAGQFVTGRTTAV